ncbi:MAG: tetratricopeptide repeat protein [Magnetospirillum sp.]|nr:MAG: tetratricopeptide repeat protein [Magnetospirillum sp.]
MNHTAATVRARLAGLAKRNDGDVRPVEAALLLAALERPDTGVEGCLAYMAELADEVRALAPGHHAEQLAEALFEVIGRRHRFRGDDRDDDEVDNANLICVINNRRGGAAALGLLVLDVARGAGLAVDGLAFPVSFLLRIQDGGGRRLILDPSAGGRTVEPPEMRALLKSATGLAAELEPAHYTAMGNREMVVRLQNEIKLRLLRCGRIDRALGVVEATLLLAPDLALLWREAGLMHMRLDNPGGAVVALEQFIARTTNAQARARTQALLAELKGRLQ